MSEVKLSEVFDYDRQTNKLSLNKQFDEYAKQKNLSEWVKKAVQDYISNTNQKGGKINLLVRDGIIDAGIEGVIRDKLSVATEKLSKTPALNGTQINHQASKEAPQIAAQVPEKPQEKKTAGLSIRDALKGYGEGVSGKRMKQIEDATK